MRGPCLSRPSIRGRRSEHGHEQQIFFRSQDVADFNVSFAGQSSSSANNVQCTDGLHLLMIFVRNVPVFSVIRYASPMHEFVTVQQYDGHAELVNRLWLPNPIFLYRLQQRCIDIFNHNLLLFMTEIPLHLTFVLLIINQLLIPTISTAPAKIGTTKPDPFY